LMISENVEFLPPIFYAVFWQPFWKWQTSWKFWKTHTCSSNGDLSLCQILCLSEFHETWWSYRYMFLVGPNVFSFVVKGVKVIFWGITRYDSNRMLLRKVSQTSPFFSRVLVAI
jgi:hypothetical protein